MVRCSANCPSTSNSLRLPSVKSKCLQHQKSQLCSSHFCSLRTEFLLLFCDSRSRTCALLCHLHILFVHNCSIQNFVPLQFCHVSCAFSNMYHQACLTTLLQWLVVAGGSLHEHRRPSYADVSNGGATHNRHIFTGNRVLSRVHFLGVSSSKSG